MLLCPLSSRQYVRFVSNISTCVDIVMVEFMMNTCPIASGGAGKEIIIIIITATTPSPFIM